MNDREMITFIWNPKSLSFWRVKVNVDNIEWIENDFNPYLKAEYYNSFSKEDNE